MAAVTLLICLGSSAQEIPLLPADKHVVPDSVVYRVLMHHAAAFDKKATELEAKGLDGTPYRRHFEQKLGLSPAEVVALMRIARDYQALNQKYELEVARILKEFKGEKMPGGVIPPDQTPPPPPEAFATLSLQRDAATLAARDKLKLTLGERQFEKVDAGMKASFQKITGAQHKNPTE